MTVIETQGLTKRYGSVTAVENLSVRIDEGEIFGFLGPNGAGKSTTINMLLDFVRPTAGSARLFGMNCQEKGKAIRQRIGVLPEGYDVYGRLTGREHLEFVVESKNANEDIDELLSRVGIADDAGRKAGDYSKGMKQRLVLAMALVGDPNLLVLDEPTTGLDPNGAREVRGIIREENDRGTTVFFSSHILEQVEAVCDRVGILRDGELVADDSIEGLRANVGGGETLIVEGGGFGDDVLRNVEAMDGVAGVQVRANGTELAVNCDEDINKSEVLGVIEDLGARVGDFSTEEASLEELFAAYTTDYGSGKA
ncbi:ABC transporter ATP-binding protein [Halobacteriales archaeon QH_10_65_19]|nr:MAG: ABC transporter ATP-binding protein [Halobacteriales archaeon QH_10_65_19]